MLSLCFFLKKKCSARKCLIPFSLERLGGCWRNDNAVDDTALETPNLENDDSLIPLIFQGCLRGSLSNTITVADMNCGKHSERYLFRD